METALHFLARAAGITEGLFLKILLALFRDTRDPIGLSEQMLRVSEWLALAAWLTCGWRGWHRPTLYLFGRRWSWLHRWAPAPLQVEVEKARATTIDPVTGKLLIQAVDKYGEPKPGEWIAAEKPVRSAKQPTPAPPSDEDAPVRQPPLFPDDDGTVRTLDRLTDAGLNTLKKAMRATKKEQN